MRAKRLTYEGLMAQAFGSRDPRFIGSQEYHARMMQSWSQFVGSQEYREQMMQRPPIGVMPARFIEPHQRNDPKFIEARLKNLVRACHENIQAGRMPPSMFDWLMEAATLAIQIQAAKKREETSVSLHS